MVLHLLNSLKDSNATQVPKPNGFEIVIFCFAYGGKRD